MTTRKLIAIFSLNQAVHWFIIGLIIPITALFQLEKGLDVFQIGIVAAVYGTTVILLELPTGGLADAIGRKRVYLISLVMLFGAALVLLIAWNFFTMSAGFFLWGVARALSSGSLDAWFVDEYRRVEPEGNLQAALAKVGIFIPAGLGIGSLVGGVLPMSFGKIISQIPGLGMYSANLLTVSICIVIQFILTFILVIEHLHPDRALSIWTGFKQFPTVVSTSVQYGIKHRIIFLLLLSSLAWGVGVMGLEVLWQPRVKNILGSDSQTWIFGLLAAGYFFASSAGNLVITPICKTFGNNYAGVLFGTRLLMGTCLCLLALQGNLLGFTGLYWILFVFNGMSNSPYMTIFNTYVPEAQRSTLLSFQSFFEQIGGLVGSMGLGYTAKTLSIPVAWFLGAEILVVSSLVFIFLSRNNGKI